MLHLRYRRYVPGKSIQNVNPSFMKQIFQLRETNSIVQTQCKLNFSVPKVNQVIHG